ncbi:hypothetical protein LCGC14_3049820 [marine sediment metagenome]|uniref:Uncharacterized protein n=1 Tax=marine sediment metagenome TaxID=412755 RepID=A0A0F8WM30_9ZZZZ
MPYTKLNWVAGVTPLSEANMDHLEEQYDEAVAELAFHTRSATLADITVLTPSNAALAASTWEALIDVTGSGPYYLISGLVTSDSVWIAPMRYTIDGAGPTTIGQMTKVGGGAWNIGMLIPVYALTSLKIEVQNSDGGNPHAYLAQLFYRS